jgi:hypothetical protein
VDGKLALANARGGALPSSGNPTDSFSLYSFTPLDERLGGWVLLGERNKFVSASSARFSNVGLSTTSSTATAGAAIVGTPCLEVELEGSADEMVELAAITPSGKVLFIDAVLELPYSTVRLCQPVTWESRSSQ